MGTLEEEELLSGEIMNSVLGILRLKHLGGPELRKVLARDTKYVSIEELNGV